MKKVAFYRLKNNDRIPWRKLQLRVVNQFQRLANPNRAVAPKSAFIVDDTVDGRVRRKVEGISSIHDYVAGRKSKKLGFKNLTLGLFDGKSFMPVDFSLHAEKLLNKKHRKEQHEKERDARSNGAKRKRELHQDKITSAMHLIKRAVKHGLKANYMLVDSWFPSKAFIGSVRDIQNRMMHVICAVHKDRRKYTYRD